MAGVAEGVPAWHVHPQAASWLALPPHLGQLEREQCLALLLKLLGRHGLQHRPVGLEKSVVAGIQVLRAVRGADNHDCKAQHAVR